MTPEQMLQRTLIVGIDVAVNELLDTPTVVACADAPRYADFCKSVTLAYPKADQVFIAGSGN